MVCRMKVTIVKQPLPKTASAATDVVLWESLNGMASIAEADELGNEPTALLNPCFPLIGLDSVERAMANEPPFALVANGQCGLITLADPGGFTGFSQPPADNAKLPAAESLSMKDPSQRAEIEAVLQKRLRDKHSKNVFFHDVSKVRLAWDIEFGENVEVADNVWFGGGVTVGDDVVIHSFCHIEDCQLRKGSAAGPFAHIRGDTELGEEAFVGSFVNAKNAKLGRGVKIAHMAYVGDAVVGDGTKLGAGAVTCNYDGKAKHRTHIGKNALIGCNTSLIAPLTVGDDVLVGAGGVISDDVPSGHLALERTKQINLRKKSRKKT